MDWRRAKVILIAAYALLDAFLLWRVVAGSRLTVSSASAAVATIDARQLAAAGIELDPSRGLPAEVPPLPLLSVRVRAPDVERLVAAFFGGAAVQVSRFPAVGPAVAQIFATPSERLAVTRGGLIDYRNQEGSAGAAGGAAVAAALDPVWARRQADAFVARMGGLPPDGFFDYAARDAVTGRYTVRYFEVYQGLPLFTAFLNVDVGPHGVAAAQGYWLDVVPATAAAQPLIPAAEALGRLSDTLHASPIHPVRVIDVRCGYYGRNDTAAREWQVAPAWRVRLSNGVYFVNAYTGAVEE